ncbi:MAG: di-heme-cytochrome C peroxidase [Dokdonella sp.]|uniref:di-heme-cytochrome C peroxidase n=1 Tax=Dokdonella sp. TaxID=2291710 RepID=UPI003F820C52
MRRNRWLAMAGISVLLAACERGAPVADGDAVAGGGGATNLEQGWTRAVQERAWFSSFGSRLVPTAWLAVLEQAGTTRRFMADEHLDALGFLVQEATPANPDGFPIGFTHETDAAGRRWTGLGCAACHTGEVRYRGHRLRIDGGQGVLDFDAFEGELVDALRATVADEARFDRFANALGTAAEARAGLRRDVGALADRIGARHAMNRVDVPYGPGRLDAFGQIFNAIAVQFLGVTENRRAPDAPVSFPVLWDAPHLDVVQWNGSAPNAGPGPLLQNVTTALAVYGSLEITGHDGHAGYPSTIDFDHLGQIQDDLYSLRSPRWPDALFGAPDAGAAARGAKVYAQQCQSCHALSDRDDRKRELKATIVPVDEVGTDPRMQRNFLDSVSRSGAFEGRKIGVVAGDPLAAEVPTSDLVVHAAVGAALRHPLAAVRDAVAGYHTVLKAAGAGPGGYKARPLSGIWASAPYLHNGSIPSLADLLTPPASRSTRFVPGAREFDPARVGLAACAADDPHAFDTRLPGNSNAGHAYGTALADADKHDLLEYLKTL